MFEEFETPRLVLDKSILERNARRVIDHASKNGVLLRPHLKTSKSVEVAKISTGGRMSGVTVSTLREAEHFAQAGFDDVMYAVGISSNKFERVRKITSETGKKIIISTDNRTTAEAMIAFANRTGFRFHVVVEVDCGEHRGGLGPEDGEIIQIASLLDKSPYLDFCGVMTHAGHSYASDDLNRIIEVAEEERIATVHTANAIREAGSPCEIVSSGSTPTFLHASSFEGLTEARSGVCFFFDLAQYSRNMCRLEDIALSVLATVIGHNHQGSAIILDAGALAMSKDIGANTFLPDAHYGYVCDPLSMERLGLLSINTVHQEHGSVLVDDASWFDRLPIGAMVRILPNHACMTAAGGYNNYLVVEGGTVVGQWERINGW